MSRYSSSGYSSAEVRCLRDQVSIRTHSTVCQHRVVTLQPDHPPPLSPLLTRLTPGIRALIEAGRSQPPRDQALHPRPSLSRLRIFLSHLRLGGFTTSSSPPPPPSACHHCWPSVGIVCPSENVDRWPDTDHIKSISLFYSVGLQTPIEEIPFFEGIHWERGLGPKKNQ